jgi:transcriptional regulator with XRE-family HTH domain
MIKLSGPDSGRVIFCPFMQHTTSIKSLRSRWALKQDELAGLLGVSQSSISKYEKNDEIPMLGTLLGLHVIFNCSLPKLFSAQYHVVEEAVMRRAAELEGAIRGKSDYASNRKRHLLEAMMARATSRAEA